ncbi:MAG: hypothetical protein JNL96_15270 [Planctomycetaceae bacterium]|nr:hypothetical protein [Planctomycetaceae bacterium]
MSPQPVPAVAPNVSSALPPPERYWLVLVKTWALSILFHLSLLLLLGFTWHTATRPAGDAPEVLRTVELVARRDSPDGPQFVDQTAAQAQAAASANAAPTQADVQKIVGGGAASPVDISGALPKGADLAGLGLGAGPPMLGGGGLLDGPSGSTGGGGGKARTEVFGLKGEGHKFLYVFDRSGSMGGSGNRALNAAKRELLRSLADLGDVHQFQIIFYNELPTIMQLRGDAQLTFGTEQNKSLARAFIEGIKADGATQHEPALKLALQLSPDVIFFLTDADQPELTRPQLDRIARLNQGRAVINTIEFGLGPKIRKENFLDRLAAENGGASAYVDISRQ